jgi:hypothetical protein
VCKADVYMKAARQSQSAVFGHAWVARPKLPAQGVVGASTFNLHARRWKLLACHPSLGRATQINQLGS